jgi:aspartate ammonia-lyase
VYLFAAWLAHVDDELAESEVALLHEIRAILQLDQAKAEALEQLAHEIKYEEAALIPQWENSPWWEQFEQLLVRVAQMPIKG